MMLSHLAIGALSGVALVAVLVIGLAKVAAVRKRRRIRSGAGLMVYLKANIDKDIKNGMSLFDLASSTPPHRIQFHTPRGTSLSTEQEALAMLVRSIDLLVRETNVEWGVIDLVIQKSMEFSLAANNASAEKEPG
jgi:hypothetical protein